MSQHNEVKQKVQDEQLFLNAFSKKKKIHSEILIKTDFIYETMLISVDSGLVHSNDSVKSQDSILLKTLQAKNRQTLTVIIGSLQTYGTEIFKTIYTAAFI